MNYYLKLDNNYRVEINWNSHIEYCSMKGIKDLSGLDDLANLSVGDLLDFIWCSLKEGERMDKRNFNITPLDLGALLKPTDIISFLNIYKEQCQVSITKTDTQGEVKKRRGFD